MLWEPERKFQIHLDFQSFSAELRSKEVELYILKSKFGCRFPKSNLSYCHVNVAGDGQPFDSLVSLCSHFGIGYKHCEKYFGRKCSLEIFGAEARVCP